MDEEECDLALLTELLEENESALECTSGPSGFLTEEAREPDEFDELFDADSDSSSYKEEIDELLEEESEDQKENVATLFGDVNDLTDEENGEAQGTVQSLQLSPKPPTAPSQEKIHQELQDELKKLQEQMKTLQERLKMTTIGKSANPEPSQKSPGKLSLLPLKERKVQKIQESSFFSAQLDIPALPKPKQVVQKPKILPAEHKSPLSESLPNSYSQPLRSTPGNKPSGGTRTSNLGSSGTSCGTAQTVSVEKFTGLRLRRPRVSSTEMDRKMAGRKLIRLSQLKNKLATEKLEEVDWVTFGVIMKKVTPQSSNSGKTFSIWKLNDLRDLNQNVSLFLFGEVHKEHWKTEQGTVIGLLNANPMKPKEGSDEVCLSIDHAQKILIMGEALDLGTCKAKKKNGEPCTQIVNLNDCEYCSYHIQSQYKKLSAKRADLQSSFSGGKVPKKYARKGSSLKERLCRDGFYYGGVSSESYAASVASTTAPKKTIQTTLTNLVLRGTDAIVQETRQKLGLPQKNQSCSEEFKQLMELPTFGARNLKKHLAKSKSPGVLGNPCPPIQSIPASALLKQQKQRMLEIRKKRTEEAQKRFLESTAGVKRPASPSSSEKFPSQSPRPGAEFPKVKRTLSPQPPKLGRGFSEGDDVLFFDDPPPPGPKLSAFAETKKLTAIAKLRAKGHVLTKANPNCIKRKQCDLQSVTERVEKSTSSSPAEDDLEPAQKKRREQLAYLESEEFQKVLKARSKHTEVLKEAEADLQERYFEPLVKKEQMEEKMKSIREMKCRVVTCKTCNYTHFKPLETCVDENHDYHWHDGVKRFFKCPCGNRTVSLDRLPQKHCSSCGLFKWERDGMLKEKSGPKIGGETLLPRGEEHPRFFNSLK
ncbi:protein MCM10 homolog isoform X1 [Notamacropus eugenii]|uniref:protein MCM10 homolog isoform X1 n=2 Tax=Notamacropus eugenii TaxID=9315 RepID=UPI003B66C5FA